MYVAISDYWRYDGRLQLPTAKLSMQRGQLTRFELGPQVQSVLLGLRKRSATMYECDGDA